MTDEVEVIETYIKRLRFLVRIMKHKQPNDPDVVQVNRVLSIISKEDPATVINLTGPFVLKYKEYILKVAKGDVGFFYDKKTEETIKMEIDTNNGEKILGLVMRLLQMVRLEYRKCSDMEKKAISDAIVDLLRNYVQYVKILKLNA